MQVSDTEIRVATGPAAQIEADVLIVSVAEKGDLTGAAAEVDAATGGLIGVLRSEAAFRGHSLETDWIFPAPGMATKRVLLIGTGKVDAYDVRLYRRIVSAAVRLARRKGAKRICVAVNPPQAQNSANWPEVAADAALTALADSDLYKEKRSKTEVSELAFFFTNGEQAADALERGKQIAGAITFARWLGDEPSNVMTTLRLAEEVRTKAAELGVECEILDEAEMRKLGMNLLLSVADGSQYPPVAVVLRYNGGGSGPTVGLVGKGVTFDTGGISIKPAADMHYMKYDMCGAANVVGTVFALAALKSKANVVAVAGLVENMPGGRATRPGDVVKAANGKTVEIINTDAEGRLVLADAMFLAIERGAERLIDVATLTGAIKIALGDAATGVFARAGEAWLADFLDAANRAGERAWPMPVFPENKDAIKSNIADMMNTGTRFGGASNAAAFLEQFTGGKPWLHLDIAGTGWTEKETSWQSKGATGVMIRTLVSLLDAPQA